MSDGCPSAGISRRMRSFAYFVSLDGKSSIWLLGARFTPIEGLGVWQALNELHCPGARAGLS